MNLLNIHPTDLREFAKARGWVQSPEGVKHRLYVLSNPNVPRRQLVFPIDNSAVDYFESIDMAIRKLSEIYIEDYAEIVGRILTVRDDTLRLRVTRSAEERSLPLPYATSLLSGAEQLLLAGACTVLKPQTHHPRMSRTEALSLLQKSRFGHTEEGSFVLKVSCPVNAVEADSALFSEMGNIPFVRKSMMVAAIGTMKIINAIEFDTVKQTIERQKSDEIPIISANLCEALTKLQVDDYADAVELSINWSPLYENKLPQLSWPIRIKRNYFSIIDDIGRSLKSGERHKEDFFIGTVERLDGEMGPDGRRYGEVVLSLLLQEEGESVRARASLEADAYAEADKAHMTDGAYVGLLGKLHPGRQPRRLTDIVEFACVGRRPS